MMGRDGLDILDGRDRDRYDELDGGENVGIRIAGGMDEVSIHV